MKKLARFIAFLVCAAIIFSGLDQLFVRKSLYGWWNITTKVNSFFNAEPDSLDVVYCGSSHAYCSFNPLVIWEQTGLSSHVVATQRQPLWATYYYIREAIDRQHPQAVVLDCYTASKNDEYTDSATNYILADDYPFGINKLLLIKAAAPPWERFELLFKFTKYHSRWSELTADDFGYNPHTLNDWLSGYCMLTGIRSAAEKPSVATVPPIPLSEKNADYLERIIKLCEDSGTRLIILKTPSNESNEERGYYNSVAELANRYGIGFIDYNDYYEQIGIDMSTDFFDAAHLNHRGADKFSRYFAKTQLDGIFPRRETDYSLRLNRYYREFNGDYNIFVNKPKFISE